MTVPTRQMLLQSVAIGAGDAGDEISEVGSQGDAARGDENLRAITLLVHASSFLREIRDIPQSFPNGGSIMSRRIYLLSTVVLLQGCATFKFPSPMLQTDVARILSNVKREHPREKLYRQYVSGRIYLQFERIGKDNVIYGWKACTDCDWTREKMAAVYDGSYLYVTFGHHEDFFLSEPQIKSMHAYREQWFWSVVNKFQVEGRNLLMLTQHRRCDSDLPQVREWSAPPWKKESEIDCRTVWAGEKYNTLYVATVDETLAGTRDSIVGSEKESVKKRLEALEKLRREGVITED